MASEEKEKAWNKIVPPLILGGATVLAAMLPLYCSSQKRLEEATETVDTADSKNDDLRKQLASLESQIQSCKTENQSLKNSCDSISDPVDPNREVVDHDFRLKLNECKLENNSVVRCDFIATNLMGDRELSLAESRIIDDSGNEYPGSDITLGANPGRMVLPGAVPVKGTVKFASVRPGTQKLALLEITGYNWPASGGRDTIIFKFQEITM